MFQLVFAVGAAQQAHLFFENLAGFVAANRVKDQFFQSRGVVVSGGLEVDPKKQPLGIKGGEDCLPFVNLTQAVEQTKGRVI
jgi:hypothetical protein